MSKLNNGELFDLGMHTIVVLILVGCVTSFIYLMSIREVPTIDQLTPLQTVQEVRKCYSPFDIYMTDSYEIVDDNKTLITSHGRVYNLTDCNLLKDN